MSLTKVLFLFPFADTIDLSGVKGKIHHVFCLGDIVCVKLSDNGSPVKLHHISNVPNFPSDSDIEN